MDDTFVIALIDMEGNIIAHKDPGQILSYNIKESDAEHGKDISQREEARLHILIRLPMS